ncbi:MAG: hypothetical protein U0350_34530 [Caldilineaceae bacterium]
MMSPNASDLETLHAYLDNGLPPIDRAAFQARLKTDPALAVALQTEQNFRASFRRQVTRLRAPAALHAQVQTTLTATAPPALAWWQRWQHWWSTPQPIRPFVGLAYALLLLVMLGGFFWWTSATPRATDAALNELFQRHQMYFENQPALDVTGSAATITAWFAQRVPFRVSTPTLSDGWQLRGARLDDFQQQPTAHLLYIRGNGQRTSLSFFAPQAIAFPTRAQIQFEGQTFFVRDNGVHRAVLWQSGPLGYAMIGDLAIPTDDFLKLAVEARKQLP